MNLSDLIEAFASEIEIVRPELEESLRSLATADVADEAFMQALEHYSGQAQRMGEAAQMAGFPGLQAVCTHVVENTVMLALYEPPQRAPAIQFLDAWPRLIVHYLRNMSDASNAAGLVDHMRSAPTPMDEEQALKVMHMLGAMPLQVSQPEGDGPKRPVLASAEDLVLNLPADIDAKLLEGFFQEAPEQARDLVDAVRRMTQGEDALEQLARAKRVAHTLKGTGAIIGLRGITALAHQLEDIFEHFERKGGEAATAVQDAMLDAAYCLEQMVASLTAGEDYPSQAQAVLQMVLDIANRLDRGESLAGELTRVASHTHTQLAQALSDLPPNSAGLASVQQARPAAKAALRVNLERLDEMFRLSGEVSAHVAAMEGSIKKLNERSRLLLEQNLRLQKRLFELETAVDVRALSLMRNRHERAPGLLFDPLEMDQYSELHSTSHALMEEASDARLLATRLGDEIAALAGMQTRQQVLVRDLQHEILNTRMTEVASIESRLQRNIRTTCQATGKQAMLELVGGETLMDSDVLNHLADPLLHLLRNAVDHGIETPQERQRAGKPGMGLIRLIFSRVGQQVVLRCQDDGRGLNLPAIRQRALERGLIDANQALSEQELARLILMPGFSTRASVSEISGRGVGLDVVREWVETVNGTVRVDWQPDQGTAIEMRFAASLSTIQSLLVGVGGARFALPSVQIEQALPHGVGDLRQLADGSLRYQHQGRELPAYLMAHQLGIAVDGDKPLNAYEIVLVQTQDLRYALAVDALLDARELLVKDLGRFSRYARGVAGLSILGDGALAVNVDLMALLTKSSSAALRYARRIESAQDKLPGVLVVDDSLSVRNALQQLVHDAGFRVETARDGLDAIERLKTFKPQLLLTDLEMPNMNGVELTAHVRARADLHGLPIIMITSRSQDKHRQLADQAGVDQYITKPYRDLQLLETIRAILAPKENLAADA